MPRLPILRPFTAAVAAVGLLSTTSPAADPGRILPKVVSLNQPNGTLAAVLAEFTRQTGILVAPSGDAGLIPCSASFEKVSAWDALQKIADRTGTRIDLRDRGRSVALVKQIGPAQPASVDGPFRAAVRQVRSVVDFDTGRAVTELALDIHWEPRVIVVRIDAEPTVAEAADDRGHAIKAVVTRGKTPPDGALYATTIRLDGIQRTATKLNRLKGSITVTATDRMLGFRFPLADKIPATQEQDGVATTVTRAGKVDERYEVEVSLTYPPGHPEFESFESFVTGNRATLTKGGKTWPATDPEVSGDGRRVTAVYRFPATVPAGATFEYSTPAPLAEYPVRFDLRDIPLP